MSGHVFKLPPKLETFFTLNTLNKEIRQKLDHLNRAIIAYSKTHPGPEAIQRIQSTISAAAAPVETTRALISGLSGVAKLYIELVKELSPAKAPRSGEQPPDLRAITNAIEIAIEGSKRGSREMVQFTEVATEAVQKITLLLGGGKSENILLIPDNAAVARDLFIAAKKSAAVLQSSEKYFRELQQHILKVVDKAKGSPALIGEVEMIHQRWSKFRDECVYLASSM